MRDQIAEVTDGYDKPSQVKMSHRPKLDGKVDELAFKIKVYLFCPEQQKTNIIFKCSAKILTRSKPRAFMSLGLWKPRAVAHFASLVIQPLFQSAVHCCHYYGSAAELEGLSIKVKSPPFKNCKELFHQKMATTTLRGIERGLLGYMQSILNMCISYYEI